jgi:hypothetical protein
MKLVTRDSSLEPQVELSIEIDSDGFAYVNARGPDGQSWNIIGLKPDGTIYRVGGVGLKSGWRLDDLGRVKLVGE